VALYMLEHATDTPRVIVNSPVADYSLQFYMTYHRVPNPPGLTFYVYDTEVGYVTSGERTVYAYETTAAWTDAPSLIENRGVDVTADGLQLEPIIVREPWVFSQVLPE
ncbi:MAG: hypothetical protein AAF125_06440, partial [Chloroflexota bacterium]